MLSPFCSFDVSAIILPALGIPVSEVSLGATSFIFWSLSEVKAVEQEEMVGSRIVLLTGGFKVFSFVYRQ